MLRRPQHYYHALAPTQLHVHTCMDIFYFGFLESIGPKIISKLKFIYLTSYSNSKYITQ